MLDYLGQPCNQNPDYNKDSCVTEEADRLAMDSFGCTDPYGFDMENICRNATIGSKVYAKMENLEYQNYESLNCSHPCSYFDFKTTVQEEKAHWESGIYITLQKAVTVMRSQYSYNELSLVAEIGGYVGLFLGVSVLQISGLVKKTIAKLTSHMKKL